MVRNVVIESENITRSKGKNVDQGGSTETILLSTRDIKGKGKVDKRAEHKERGKKEREEGLARKMKEKDDAEERRRKEAEEDRKEKGKLPNETKAEIRERKQRTKEAEEERRIELLREAEEKKDKERRAKKERTRGKGKAAQKPSPEPPVTYLQLEAGRLVKTRMVSTAHPTSRPSSPERSLPKTSALRTSGRLAALSSPRSPSFDKRLQANQDLRYASFPGPAGRPYNAMRPPDSMYATTYAGSTSPPIFFPVEEMV